MPKGYVIIAMPQGEARLCLKQALHRMRSAIGADDGRLHEDLRSWRQMRVA